MLVQRRVMQVGHILGTANFLIATLSHPLTASELSKIYLLTTMRLAQKHLNSLKYFNRRAN